MRFPPELDLVIACCRWPPSHARDAAVAAAASTKLDWDLFARVVARHRVHGLVHDALRRAHIAPPPSIADTLATASASIVRENLRFAAASLRLTRALAGIDHLFVKGVTLNMLAYGSLGLKRAWDIDLAVDPAAYDAACEAVARAGFRPITPDANASPDERRAFVARVKHTEWADAAGIALELHAQLTDNPLLMPGLSATSPAQQVMVAPGLVLPTLAPDPLYAYLCVHGATHAWSRLKWLADVAALIAPADDAEVTRLHAAATAQGVGRGSGSALLLIARLFGRTLPADLTAELQADAGTRMLVRAGLASMVRGGADVELDTLVLGTVPIHLSHFLLGRGLRYKWSEARRKLGGGDRGPGATVATWLARRRNAAAK